MNVLMSAGGGHGTVYIWKRCSGLNMMTRPDTWTVFGRPYDHRDYPPPSASQQFPKRAAGIRIDLGKTIGENLLQALAKHQPNWCLLTGLISEKAPWLTVNRLKIYGLVRHPLDAAASFLLHRHPEVVSKWYDGNHAAAFEWYGQWWSAVVKDFLMSGSEIWRYEDMPAACGHVPELYNRIAAGWKTPKLNHRIGELKEEWCDLVWNGVKCVFGDAGYDRWK
jgi:hypothetical protein